MKWFSPDFQKTNFFPASASRKNAKFCEDQGPIVTVWSNIAHQTPPKWP